MSHPETILIKGASLLGEQSADLLIEDGVIREIGDLGGRAASAGDLGGRAASAGERVETRATG